MPGHRAPNRRRAEAGSKLYTGVKAAKVWPPLS